MSEWILEYSELQKCGHIEHSSTIKRCDGWKQIAILDCSWQEAVDWFDNWKKRRAKTKTRKCNFCHPDDRSIPIGKRKVEFVKWLMRQGEDVKTARIICSRRFWKEEHV